jgi:hypothetical protein
MDPVDAFSNILVHRTSRETQCSSSNTNGQNFTFNDSNIASENASSTLLQEKNIPNYSHSTPHPPAKASERISQENITASLGVTKNLNIVTDLYAMPANQLEQLVGDVIREPDFPLLVRSCTTDWQVSRLYAKIVARQVGRTLASQERSDVPEPFSTLEIVVLVC